MYFIIRINGTSPRIHGDSRNGSKHIVVKFKFIARLNIANLPVQSLSDFQGAYKIQIWIVFLYRTDVQDQESQYFQGWLEGIGVVETELLSQKEIIAMNSAWYFLYLTVWINCGISSSCNDPDRIILENQLNSNISFESSKLNTRWNMVQ